MATLREEAKAFEPKQTYNIAELDKVPIDIELFDGEGVDNNGKPFYYKYTKIDGKEYRVAGSVIGGIKALLKKIPNLQYITVLKQGEGMNTRYSVIPYTECETEEVKG